MLRVTEKNKVSVTSMNVSKQPSTQQSNDELLALIGRVANLRCKKSFTQLFDFFTPRVLQFAKRHVHEEQAAKELTQETMLALWRKAHMYDTDKGSLVTWVYTIARNLAFDMGRKSQRRPTLIGADDAFTDYIEYQGEPQNESVESSDKDKLWQAMELLPDKQRQVVELLYQQEMTQADVAVHLNVPLGTVKSRTRLGLAKLKEIIEQQGLEL